jgi:type I restriction enzyme S subunit
VISASVFRNIELDTLINKLKYFADIQTGSTPSTNLDSYWYNSTEDWFTPSDFNDDDIHLEGSSRKVAKAAFDESACRVFAPKTVLIVGIGATLGKVGISYKTCSANQQINAITFKENVEPLYGAYYLYSIRELMKSVANAATLAIVNQATTGDLPFVCPPIEEQRKIIETTETKVSVIRSSILEIESQISDLQSYKSSVISEAVTGKVDLRDLNKNAVTA